MPSVSLPDIDPDASNTIIASSRQGGIGFSSARDVALPARSAARTIAASLTIQRANAMPRRPDPIAQFSPRDRATLAKKPAWNRGSRVAGSSRHLVAETPGSTMILKGKAPTQVGAGAWGNNAV